MTHVYEIMLQKNSKEIHFLSKVVMDIFIYLFIICFAIVWWGMQLLKDSTIEIIVLY